MRIDSWKPFAYFCLISGLLLIILPQLWILLSSTRDDGGAFIVHYQSGELNWVDEASTKFQLRDGSTASRLIVRHDTGYEFSLVAQQARQILMKPIDGKTLSVASLGTSELRISSATIELNISQNAPLNIERNPEAPAPKLRAEEITTGIHIATTADNTYITFSDKRLYSTYQNYINFISNPNYRDAVANSLIIAFISPLLAALLAVPLAWLMARYAFRNRLAIISLVTMASVSPPFLGAYAWRFLFGGNGIVTNALNLDVSILGLHGIIWVITWRVFPLIFLVTLDSFSSSDPTLRESALSLGANKRRTFFSVEVPTALPGVVTGIYMATMAAFADFSTPYIVSLDIETLPTLIYTQFLNEVSGNPTVASTASVIMVVLSVGLLSLQQFFIAGKSFASVSARREVLEVPNRRTTLVTYAFTFIVLGTAFLPHLTVLVTSFLKWQVGIVTSTVTLQNYVDMLSNELTPIQVTLTTASAATLLSLVFGVGIAYIIVRKRYRFLSPILNFLSVFPSVLPGTVFAIGFIFAFNDGPIVLTGTWAILTLTYFIRKLPFAVKTAEATLHQVHPALEEAAVSLGATPTRAFFSITAPLVASGAITGMTLVFLQSVTELTSTILLFRPPWRTMSTVIFEQTITPGTNFGIAAAMTVFMMAILYIPLYILTRQRGK